MKQVEVKITTLSPVVLTTESHAALLTETLDYFSGSVIRGIAAKEYIRQEGLGKLAHEDAKFRGLFFSKLSFVAAYPLARDGQRSFPLPFSLQKSKDGKEVLDLIDWLLVKGQHPKVGFKSLKGLGVRTAANEIGVVEPAKSLSLHMSRTDMAEGGEGTAAIERIGGRSVDGGIYNFEAIERNQCFAGYIIGEEDALESLVETLPQSWQANIGRSKFTQYGRCRIELGDILPIDQPMAEVNSGRVFMRLETPLLAGVNRECVSDFGYQNYFQPIIDVLNEGYEDKPFCVAEARNSFFGQETELDAFVGIWGMRRPRTVALAAGSVFAVEKKTGEWTENDLCRLHDVMYRGAGPRREEGYGQVRFWIPAELKKISIKGDGLTETAPAALKSAAVQNLARQVMHKRVMEDIRLFAEEDALDIRGSIIKSDSSFFGKMGLFLDGYSTMKLCRSQMREQLRNALAEKTRGRKPLEEKLRKYKVGDETLYSLLAGAAANVPKKYKTRRENMVRSQLSDVCREIGIGPLDMLNFHEEEIFHEYWFWFFRHCRKIANMKNSASEEAVDYDD